MLYTIQKQVNKQTKQKPKMSKKQMTKILKFITEACFVFF